MILDILEIGHPVLREVAREVGTEELATGQIQSLIDSMIETKRDAQGAGIAAPQIGESLRIFVVEVQDNKRYPYKPEIPLFVLINPQVSMLTEERFENYEGCLSIPNLRGIVQRCPRVKVSGLDRAGKKLELEVRGVSAGTFQHEDDHLNGVLFPDRVQDTHSFCTWAEFEQRQQEQFAENVRSLEQRYSAEGVVSVL